MSRFAPLLVAVAVAVAGNDGAWAQVPGAPSPIPVPPIPAPPQLGAPPHIELPKLTPPGRPDIQIPDAAELTPVAIPAEAPITPADKNDPVPPPPSGLKTPAPPMVSPGAVASRIDELAFLVDPGSSQLSKAAESKLGDVATTLAKEPAARVEVRTYSPRKDRSESNARRLSLSRFLVIRKYLADKGVAEARIDGRPLITQPNELNADRVELYIER
jgi:outer membrane protein OmpA-like peptidoglycan-associated protein